MKIAEHRAAARIARRTARRSKGRTALILILIALPVMALTAAGFMIRSAMASPEEQATGTLGSADMTVNSYPETLTTEKLVAAFPAGTRVSFSRYVDVTRIVDGKTWYTRFLETSVPADRLPVGPRYALMKGRMPRAPGEVAIHPDMVGLFGVAIGGRLVVDDAGLDLRVVGIEVVREDLRNVQALVAPGTFAGRADAYTLDWLIDLPPGAGVNKAIEAVVPKLPDVGFTTRAEIVHQRIADQRALTVAAFGIAVVAIFGTALIAAAAFGVGARRQLRSLGILGAAGGEPRHVRATVLWGGTVLGFAGSIAGVALAIATSFAAKPHLGRFVGRIVPAVRLPWLILAGGIVLGTLAATLAAFGPARQAGRLATVDALAGRSPAPRAPGRLAGRGLLAVIAGGGLITLGTMKYQQNILAAGLVVTLAGFLLAIPLLVTWVGRAPTRLPTSLRLAARQTARYGRRTGAAVAAATLALTAPVAIAAYTLSDDAFSNNQVTLTGDMLLVNTQSTALQNDALLKAVRRSIPGSVGGVTRLVTFPAPGGRRDTTHLHSGSDTDAASIPAIVDEPALEREPAQERGAGAGSFDVPDALLYAADAGLLRALHAESAVGALASGKIVVIGPYRAESTVTVHSPRTQAGFRSIQVPAVFVRRAKHGIVPELPHYLIAEEAAVRLGMKVQGASNGIIRAPHALSGRDIAAAQQASGRFPGASMTTRGDWLTDSTSARLLITGAAAIVALIIVAIAVALVGAESRREYAVLVAVGADPGRRRRTVAANALFVSALAGILAVPAGFLPVVIIEFARRANRPIVAPWSVIGIVAIGAPLIAAAIAAVASREPSSRSLLQPIW